MILPSKHLNQDRALLTVGACVFKALDKSKTVSALWENLCRMDKSDPEAPPLITYDWFVLALDLLFALGAIEFNNGLVARASK